MVRSPLLKPTESADVPLTVKSLGATVPSLTASLRLTTKAVGAVPTTRLPQAGSVVVTEKPTSSLSVKASCWELPPMATRPSATEDGSHRRCSTETACQRSRHHRWNECNRRRQDHCQRRVVHRRGEPHC